MAIGWRWNARRFQVPQALVLGTVILLIVVSMVWIMPKLDAMHHAKYADYFGLNVTLKCNRPPRNNLPLHPRKSAICWCCLGYSPSSFSRGVWPRS